MARPEVAARVVDVQELIDAQPLSPVQKLLLLLCFAVVVIERADRSAPTRCRQRFTQRRTGRLA